MIPGSFDSCHDGSGWFLKQAATRECGMEKGAGAAHSDALRLRGVLKTNAHQQWQRNGPCRWSQYLRGNPRVPPSYPSLGVHPSHKPEARRIRLRLEGAEVGLLELPGQLDRVMEREQRQANLPRGKHSIDGALVERDFTEQRVDLVHRHLQHAHQIRHGGAPAERMRREEPSCCKRGVGLTDYATELGEDLLQRPEFRAWLSRSDLAKFSCEDGASGLGLAVVVHPDEVLELLADLRGALGLTSAGRAARRASPRTCCHAFLRQSAKAFRPIEAKGIPPPPTWYRYASAKMRQARDMTEEGFIVATVTLR